MADLDLALVFTPDQWVEELHRHLADHGGARVLHLVVDPAMALHERFDVLVVSWRWPSLTPGLVEELHALGRGVLGVADREERSAADVLTACGVDAIVHSDAAPWEYVDALASVQPAHTKAGELHEPPGHDAAPTVRRHPITAVCGPAGTGRTELAIELARQLSAPLVDADEIAPAIAARLGLELEPNVRAAVDAVEFNVGDPSAALQRVAGLERGVLCGMPSAHAWSHVRSSEFVRVLHALARRAPVVVDTSASIDDVGRAPRGRYDVTRAVVSEADAVVAVGLATPLGVVRLLGWLADAERLRPGLPAHVVLNRSTSAPFRRAELTCELLRSCRPLGLVHLPDDERVRAAGWKGSLVARGPFTKSVAEFVAQLASASPRAVAS